MAKAKRNLPTEETRTVAQWAEARGMENWRLAGLLRMTRWTADKHVTADEFTDASERLATRRTGGR